jgi:hypothetical protein
MAGAYRARLYLAHSGETGPAIKESCLDRMILFGEAGLRRSMREFIQHYHWERNHQGLGNRLIHESPHTPPVVGPVHCRERVGRNVEVLLLTRGLGNKLMLDPVFGPYEDAQSKIQPAIKIGLFTIPVSP